MPEIIAILALIWLVPLALLIMGFGGRPKAERFLAVNGFAGRASDVDHVRAILRRTYRSRLIGAFAGLTIGFLTALRIGPTFAVSGAIIGLLMGSMVGITVAQSRRATTDPSAPRSASLTVRDAHDYLPRHASVTIGVLAALVLGYGIVAIGVAGIELGPGLVVIFGLGIATILAVPLGRRFERRTAELRRAGGDEAVVQIDDAVRASAIRGIHRSTIGVLLCGFALLGAGTVATQSWTAVVDGPKELLRIPAGSTVNLQQVSPVPGAIVPSPGTESRWRVDWSEFGNSSRSRTLRASTADVRLDSSGGDSMLIGVGALVGFVGFLGACIQWVRAANAWRKPQLRPPLPNTTPTPLGAAP